MLREILVKISLPLILLLSLSVNAQSECNFEERKAEYLENILQTASGSDLLVLQAFHDLPLDQHTLNDVLEHIQTVETADFTITKLIRVLNFTDGEYDEQILAVLNTIPFWLPDTEGPDRQYWSENHMIMWMSADWLLHERTGREIRPTLRQMIVKWLDMKIEYGFYEYFSPIYYPYTTAAMLNLVDFAEDDEIKEKAIQAATRLMTDIMLVTNDRGYYFSTCGRGNMGKYSNGNVGGIGTLVRFISGIGETPTNSHIGALALATSHLDATDICATWASEVNTTLHYGHPLSEARNIYNELTREDRIIFQWSSGAYFHPLVAQETMWQVSNFNLWEHEEFSGFSFAQFLPPAWGNVFAKIAASISRSSYIGNVEIDIYKNGGVMLNSSQDMWKGRGGYQVYPIVAAVESLPILLRSGEIYPNWNDVPDRRSNDHMPYVDQDENVALVMYKPNWDLPIWGYGNSEVALKWESPAFDEERAFDNWQLGRIDDSYIAVKKHCDEYISGIPACPDDDGQTWAIIVGSAATHGNFDEFEAMVSQAVYEERWYFNWQKLKWVYYGHINADGKDIDHHWLGNLWDAPDNPNGREGDDDGRFGQLEASQVNLFPNPARDQFTLDLHAYDHQIRSIYVMNIAGQEMFQKTVLENNVPFEVIYTSDWQQGTYTVVIENLDGSVNVKRLVVVR